MDDSRELFIQLVRNRGKTIIDNERSWDTNFNTPLLECIFYVICSYIRQERNADTEWGMGRLERDYLCSDEFIEAADERKWIEQNRQKDDNGLIVYVFDNIYNMKSGKHRRAILYLLNMLYFDL
tara:strand:+ start:837 stop:1208 length:372 start_codon:yes stop_codon:yes gene_type:complete